MHEFRIKGKVNFACPKDKCLFIAETLGFCEARTMWAYNIDTNTLGHGDDQRVWYNEGEKFIPATGLDGIDFIDYAILIWYDTIMEPV